MSTTMPKADAERKWYVVDAANKPLGRTAATVASILRGKHKTTFAPHADCGDFVIVINAEKAVKNDNMTLKAFKFFARFSKMPKKLISCFFIKKNANRSRNACSGEKRFAVKIDKNVIIGVLVVAV